MLIVFCFVSPCCACFFFLLGASELFFVSCLFWLCSNHGHRGQVERLRLHRHRRRRVAHHPLRSWTDSQGRVHRNQGAPLQGRSVGRSVRRSVVLPSVRCSSLLPRFGEFRLGSYWRKQRVIFRECCFVVAFVSFF